MVQKAFTNLRFAVRTAGVFYIFLIVFGGYAESTRQPLMLRKEYLGATDAFTIKTIVWAFYATGIGDFVVAWALHLYFRVGSCPQLSLLAAWTRVGYAVLLLSNIPSLFVVARVLQQHGDAKLSAAIISSNMDSFDIAFEGVGLLLFGVHLCLLGIVCWKSAHGPSWWLSLLLFIAGLGYVLDSADRLVEIEPTLYLTSSGMFIGEVLLFFWLVYQGIWIDENVVLSDGNEFLLDENEDLE
jgi:hypothetical protein